MVETIRVFLAEEALATLEDKYIEEDENALHRFVFGIVRDIARGTKMILMNGEIPATIHDENGKMQGIKLALKDTKLPEIVFNKDWQPESKGAKLVPYELKVGEKTTSLLHTAYQIYMIRAQKFNETLPESDKNRKQKMITPSTCFEDFMHGGLIMPIMAEVESSINNELDREFNAVYPTKKPEPIPKKR